MQLECKWVLNYPKETFIEIHLEIIKLGQFSGFPGPNRLDIHKETGISRQKFISVNTVGNEFYFMNSKSVSIEFHTDGLTHNLPEINITFRPLSKLPDEFPEIPGKNSHLLTHYSNC
jgi:hypothetical protein